MHQKTETKEPLAEAMFLVAVVTQFWKQYKKTKQAYISLYVCLQTLSFLKLLFIKAQSNFGLQRV